MHFGYVKYIGGSQDFATPHAVRESATIGSYKCIEHWVIDLDCTCFWKMSVNTHGDA